MWLERNQREQETHMNQFRGISQSAKEKKKEEKILYSYTERKRNVKRVTEDSKRKGDEDFGRKFQ